MKATGMRVHVALDQNDFAVCLPGERITLTRTQYLLLDTLMVRCGEWIRVDEILDLLWGKRTSQDASAIVRVHIHSLRKALQGWAWLIESDPRRARGYRVHQEVEVLRTSPLQLHPIAAT